MADQKLAKQIIEAVGGADNVRTLGHCMTRLRFSLKDQSKANDDIAGKIPGVKGISRAAGQYQMIIGTGVVDDYFDTIMENYSFAKTAYSDMEEGKDFANENFNFNPGSLISNALGIVSGSIAPWLGCIMGSLMISAILSLFVSMGILSTDNTTFKFFSAVSGACIYSLPVLVGFSAAERLETNRYMGALLGAIMIYPTLSNAVAEGTVGIFGLNIQKFSYTSTIIPVLLVVWLLKYVEKFAKKICPQVIYIFGVTLIELLITVPLIFLVVGPIGVIITNAISNLVLFIYYHAGILAPAVAGAIMPIAVMAGVHLGLFPIAALMITNVGYDPIIHPALMVYNMSIAGASLAYGLRSKNVDNRSLGISSGVSGILGISEAGLFGIVLPNKRILLTTEIGILISGIITGFTGYKCYIPLSQSVFSIPAAAHGDFNMMACMISLVSGVAASFIVTFFFGGVGKDTASNDSKNSRVKYEHGKVYAPINGDYIKLSEIPDPVFSAGTLGKGCGILPADNKIYAPVDGEVVMIAETKHAIGIRAEDGTEIMIHIGLDTVDMKGKGFYPKVIGGDHVTTGQLIMEFSAEAIIKAGHPSTTALIVTNSDNYSEISIETGRKYTKAAEIGFVKA